MMNRIRHLNTSDTYEKQATAIDAMQVDGMCTEHLTLNMRNPVYMLQLTMQNLT